jgi:hypothetical protein
MNDIFDSKYSETDKELIFSKMPDNLKSVLLSIYSIICDNAKNPSISGQIQEQIDLLTSTSAHYQKIAEDKETELKELRSVKNNNNRKTTSIIDKLNSDLIYVSNIIMTVQTMLNNSSLKSIEEITEYFSDFKINSNGILDLSDE